MRKLINSNKYLLLLFTLTLILGTVTSVICGRTGTHLFLNRYHSAGIDQVMKIWTYMGDGLVMLAFAIILFFRKIRYGLIFLTSFLLSSLIVQILKRFVFDGFPRPVKYFAETGIELYLVPGIKYHYMNSFPSGHSATAFALFIGIAFLVKNNALKVILFIFACGVAYTRVYLSQHFLIDTVFGSLIGVVCAMISHWYFFSPGNYWMNIPVYKVYNRK